MSSRTAFSREVCHGHREAIDEPPWGSSSVPEDRRIWTGVCKIATATRDRALEEREELVRLRELALDARGEADDARAEREHLLGQLREANERLVTAIARVDLRRRRRPRSRVASGSAAS